MEQRFNRGAPIWYCPVFGCPYTAGRTEKIVLHLEGVHGSGGEVIRRELDRFEKVALNGGIACGKLPDGPEHPKR